MGNRQVFGNDPNTTMQNIVPLDYQSGVMCLAAQRAARKKAAAQESETGDEEFEGNGEDEETEVVNDESEVVGEGAGSEAVDED